VIAERSFSKVTEDKELENHQMDFQFQQQHTQDLMYKQLIAYE
tara:strand:+ start:621 stop:749 length:129 start_codon:yes stop_codon:yes gene_type:complete